MNLLVQASLCTCIIFLRVNVCSSCVHRHMHIYTHSSLSRVYFCEWIISYPNTITELFTPSPLSQSSIVLILKLYTCSYTSVHPSGPSSLFHGSIYLILCQNHIVFIIILYNNIFWKSSWQFCKYTLLWKMLWKSWLGMHCIGR